jgi:hypothetical protein
VSHVYQVQAQHFGVADDILLVLGFVIWTLGSIILVDLETSDSAAAGYIQCLRITRGSLGADH